MKQKKILAVLLLFLSLCILCSCSGNTEKNIDTGYTCTISVSCKTVLDHKTELNANLAKILPEDGWILEPMNISFYDGESVFDVLLRVMQEQKIHMEYTDTPIYDSAYIEGIANLYEFDAGPHSGWMYSVNDRFPNYGCSNYVVEDGDVICLVYTCDLGKDVENENAKERAAE